MEDSLIFISYTHLKWRKSHTKLTKDIQFEEHFL